MLNKIHCMDNVEGLRQLIPDDSIDLTVTSPPYDNLRDYKGQSFRFEELAHELYRVTKPGGVVVWIVGDATINGSETGTSFKQALYFKDNVGFRLHDTMIYQKINPVPLTHNRYQPCFEYMFVFSKGKPKTFNPIREPSKHAGEVRSTRTARKKNGKTVSFTHDKMGTPIPSTKVKHNIWAYHVGYMHSSKDKLAFDHPAIFPEKLAEDHILSWSNPGDVVLDPFMGSGTVAIMALLNNRNYVGFEISEDYVNISNKRIESVKVERGELNSVTLI